MQVLMMKRKHKFEIFVLFLTIQIFQHEEIKIKKKKTHCPKCYLE